VSTRHKYYLGNLTYSVCTYRVDFATGTQVRKGNKCTFPREKARTSQEQRKGQLFVFSSVH
jgi:hypothetical protein